jgi:hypothetical protein
MIKEGYDLVSLVNETAKLVGPTVAQIDSMMLRAPKGRPFDIMDYYNTVLSASDVITKANTFLDSADQLIASPKWEQQRPGMLTITSDIASEGKSVITHAFVLGIALIISLIIVFSLVMLVLIRYAAKQYRGLRQDQGGS